VCCSVLQCDLCVAVCDSEACHAHRHFTQCVAVGCSELRWDAVSCGEMQCVAVRCSELQWDAVCCNALQCVASYCDMLQCVTVCCSEA